MDAIVFYRNWERCRPTFGSSVETDITGAYTPELFYSNVENDFGGRKSAIRYFYNLLNQEDVSVNVNVPRSMSVGDLVIFSDFDVWVCAPSGLVRREDLVNWARVRYSSARCYICQNILSSAMTARAGSKLCMKCNDTSTD